MKGQRNLFSSQLANEKIARYVITKHHKTVAHTFRIAKEEVKESLIIDTFLKTTFIPQLKLILTALDPLNGDPYTIPNLKPSKVQIASSEIQSPN